MLIFLDTEFTDFNDCDLIAISMVSEDGQHEFYAERSDYEKAWASPFVLDAVLPYGNVGMAHCPSFDLCG